VRSGSGAHELVGRPIDLTVAESTNAQTQSSGHWVCDAIATYIKHNTKSEWAAEQS
jgi:hypothetical protein